jgi:hypothetical protein
MSTGEVLTAVVTNFTVFPPVEIKKNNGNNTYHNNY